MTDKDVLFVPGRGSYVTSGEKDSFILNSTAATAHRAEVAADTFDESRHESVLFSGGYPGLAQKWPQEQIDAIVSSNQNEATLMATRFTNAKSSDGMSKAALEQVINKEGTSDDSISNVLESINLGLLNPNDFQTNERGIALVTGYLHSLRFRPILAKALDMNPKLITRVPMRDVYGLPETEFHHADPVYAEVGKEMIAVAVNAFLFSRVHSGNLNDIHVADKYFKRVAGMASH